MTYVQLEDSFLGTLHTEGINTPQNAKHYTIRINFGDRDNYLYNCVTAGRVE